MQRAHISAGRYLRHAANKKKPFDDPNGNLDLGFGSPCGCALELRWRKRYEGGLARRMEDVAYRFKHTTGLALVTRVVCRQDSQSNQS